MTCTKTNWVATRNTDILNRRAGAVSYPSTVSVAAPGAVNSQQRHRRPSLGIWLPPHAPLSYYHTI